MMEYFREAREGLRLELRGLLEARSEAYGEAAPGLGPDAAKRLSEFSSKGKMLRGALVRLGYELAGGRSAAGPDLDALAKAGAAMELFQSGLLVHDDIMDGDLTRRGAPTVHAAYESALAEASFPEAARTGESLGICAGDLAYFEAFSALASLPLAPDRIAAVVGLAARELALVGVAQMRDVVNGATGHAPPRRDREPAEPRWSALAGGAGQSSGSRPASFLPSSEPTEAEIIAMYRYKTGRYTFSLPLAIGAVIAGASDEARIALEEAGEELGIAFQLKDDELGLFADEAELGKPVGSDIREDKKTLHRLRLFGKAKGETAARLESMFGNQEPGAVDPGYVRDAAEALGVRSELAREMEARTARARERVSWLSATAPRAAAAAFEELLAYGLARRS